MDINELKEQGGLTEEEAKQALERAALMGAIVNKIISLQGAETIEVDFIDNVLGEIRSLLKISDAEVEAARAQVAELLTASHIE